MKKKTLLLLSFALTVGLASCKPVQTEDSSVLGSSNGSQTEQLPSQSQNPSEPGSTPTEGSSTNTSTGTTNVPTEGSSTNTSTGTTNIPTEGSGTNTSTGTTNVPTEGSGTNTSTGTSTPTEATKPIVTPDKKKDGFKYTTEGIENITAGSGKVSLEGEVKVTKVSGTIEAGYVVYQKCANATGYNIYLDDKLVDERIAYTHEENNLMRTDLIGITAGNHQVKIIPVYNERESADTPTLVSIYASAYDRSGYAHFNYNDGVGAYNDDGTLKKNAYVLYVDDTNKNDVTITVNGTTVSGIGNILNSVGMECGEAGHEGECKKISNDKIIYAKANTNAGIIKKLSENKIPLAVRFVGTVSDSGLYKKGSFDASSASLIKGLTEYDSNNYGGSVGDNGHMARIKSGKDITLEGVGETSVIDGWGFHFIAETATTSQGFGKSFEVRNLTFINTPEDAIGMEGQQSGGKITASVERCWIHNNEMYGPSILNPAESDKSEGDGSCDFKRGMYLTVSYNYFEGCHKTNLVGSSDSSLQYNLTYHHNYWYLCKARGPLARQANIHMYNNIFEGQTDFCMNTRANAYIFSEYNLFYGSKNPQRVDNGAIKSYNDSLSSYVTNATLGTVVTDKNAKVVNNCSYNGTDYSSFDTDSKLSYIPTNNYQLQTSQTEARLVIKAKAGVLKDNQIAPKDVNLNSISYVDHYKNGSSNKITLVEANSNTLTPGKIEKGVYAFTIKTPKIVEIKYADDTFGKSGVLCSVAGELILTGSGKVVLYPGTYIIQPDNLQPGDSGKLTEWVFKSCTVTSISFEDYNSEEYQQQIIAEYEKLVGELKDNITYTEEVYNKIMKAISSYSSIENKDNVTPYSVVEGYYNEFIKLGTTLVTDKINEIGTVTKDSGLTINSARKEYDKLISYYSDAKVENYNVLVEAEKTYKTFSLDACIEAINNIGTVTLESKDKIDYAFDLYNSLSDEEQAKVTNYSTLEEKLAQYESLVKVNDFNTLLTTVDLTSLASLEEVITSYNKLAESEKNNITDKETLSSVKINYTIKLIDNLPADIKLENGNDVKKAKEMYDSLNDSEKEAITNYDKLTKAISDYDAIASQTQAVSFENKSLTNNPFFTVSGNIDSKKYTKEYAGVTYTVGLKLESSTSIKFTTSAKTTLTIVANAANKKIIVNNVAYATDANGILILELNEAKEYTITKGDTNVIFAVIVG